MDKKSISFTIIELIIVIEILGILSVVTVSRLKGFISKA